MGLKLLFCGSKDSHFAGLKTSFYVVYTAMSISASKDGNILVHRRHFAGVRTTFCGPNTVILQVGNDHFADLTTAILWV